MVKKRKSSKYIGSVGAYLVRESSSGVLQVMVGRRSMKVSEAKNELSTPGGVVDKVDMVAMASVVKMVHICEDFDVRS